MLVMNPPFAESFPLSEQIQTPECRIESIGRTGLVEVSQAIEDAMAQIERVELGECKFECFRPRTMFSFRLTAVRAERHTDTGPAGPSQAPAKAVRFAAFERMG